MALFQFPSVTICPNHGFPSHPWGFLEDYLDILDPQAPEVQEMFKFIPTFLHKKRKMINDGAYRQAKSDHI